MVKEKLRNILAFSLVLFLSLGLAGCFSKNTSQEPSPTPDTSNGVIEEEVETPSSEEPAVIEEEEPELFTISTSLYFPTADASGLRSVKRELTFNETEPTLEEKIKAVFGELAKPGEGLMAFLPNGTKLLNVTVKDGTATLDLSQEFRDNFIGGATNEQLVLSSIVNTLTNLDGVDRVEFLLEGELMAAILGGIDTSVPLTPNPGMVVN